MSRSSSPATHWDQLETWLSALTSGLLPETASDLQHLSREQLDDGLSLLMANDPAQSYNHKELAKIIGALAHNLIVQSKLSEGNVTSLEQEVTALKLQAQEARRNQEDAERRVDQLTRRPREQQAATDEEDQELREQVERLQDALADLRTDTEHREQLEKETRKELAEELQHAEALLVKAEAELKERTAKVKACEGHLQTARAEARDLAQQRDHLKAERDAAQSELKYAYQLRAEHVRKRQSREFSPPSGTKPFRQELQAAKGGERPLFNASPASTLEPLTTTEWGRGPIQRTSADIHGVSPRDIDKLARNIPTFTPDTAGDHEVHAYLQDIDFHFQTMANATTRDRLYLLRITSSHEVRRFLDRQSEAVRADYKQLQQALIREFSDPELEQGLVTAMDLKQGRQETPQAYYNRLRQAYFGSRNEPEMEEDFNFRTLFLRNLHPSVSHHLGVMACPHTMTTRQLRDLVHKAFGKQKATTDKTAKNPSTLSVAEHFSGLPREGTQQQHRAKPFDRESWDFTENPPPTHWHPKEY